MKNKNIVEFIIKIIKGMVVGLGTLTAGAGTFAIVLGIYDRCMEIIAKPFKNFKDNVKYVFPILLGIVISILIFKNTVCYLFENYTSYVKCVFFGIILGGLPSLINVANKKGKNKKNWITFFVALLITVILTFLGSLFGKNTLEHSKMEEIYLIIYGAIYGIGAILPGMTTMHVLIFLGVWGKILSGILSGSLSIIMPFGIGYIAIILLMANLMSFCFEKFYGHTYYAIIGFSVTSLLMLVPNFKNILESVLGIVLGLVTTVIIYKITKLENKIKEKESELI